MKEIKTKKCKACTGEFKPYKTTDRACSPECERALQTVKERKQQAKSEREAFLKIYSFGGRKKGKTKAQCDNDLKTRKKAAKEACHKYIRERDKFKPCPCCNKPLGEDFHAGHFLESGNNPKIRYDEDNIHGQRVDCNFFKGGDSGMYRVNLIERIGLERVERLESLQGGVVKRTPQDYAEIEKYFKEKLKNLIEERNEYNI